MNEKSHRSISYVYIHKYGDNHLCLVEAHKKAESGCVQSVACERGWRMAVVWSLDIILL